MQGIHVHREFDTSCTEGRGQGGRVRSAQLGGWPGSQVGTCGHARGNQA